MNLAKTESCEESPESREPQPLVPDKDGRLRSAFDPTSPSREEGWDVVLLHTAGNVLKYRISVYLYFCILKHRIKNQTAPEHPSSCV